MRNSISETCQNLILIALVTLVTMTGAGLITRQVISKYYSTPDYTSSSSQMLTK